MSGHSDSAPCPNCGESCDQYMDWKPFNYTTMTCWNCGLMIYPTLKYMDLEELNEYREMQCNMEPLDTLPKQEEDIW